MTTLYLVRHGETNGNLDGKFQGVSDYPLNKTGISQGELVGMAMKDFPIDVIYSSPLTRTQETARFIASHHSLTAILDAGLLEINGGVAEGEKLSDLDRLFPECMQNMMNCPALVYFPEGESMRQVYDRMKLTVEKIVGENKNKVIVAVSHGCAISTYLHCVSGKPFEEMPHLIVANTAINRIDFDDALAPTLIFQDDHRHLPQGQFIEIIRG